MLTRLKLRLRALFFKSRMEEELSEEVRFHLEREIEQNLARGMSPEEARAAASRSFGGVAQVQERCRDERGVRLLEELWHNLRHSSRMLLKNPGFTAISVLTLALGIGANSAVFSVVNSILLQPLPYRDSDRLVTVYQISGASGKPSAPEPISAPNYFDYRDQNTVFESVSLFTGTNLNLTGQGEPEQLSVLRVSASYFSTLGVEAVLGRTFSPEEEQPRRDGVVILSHNLWHRRFGGVPNVIGRTLTLDDKSYTVIGVMPASLYGETEIWVPIALSPLEMKLREWNHLSMIARLKPGINVEQAQAEMNVIVSRINRQYPQLLARGGWGAGVKSLYEQSVGEIRRALLVLSATVGFVLLIACANVANLLLARSAARRKEIAIRLALGAGRGRIVRQLLTESALLALLGGGLGLMLSFWGVKLLVAFNRENLPRWQEIRLDSRVLVFTIVTSVLTSLLFGLAPAFLSSKIHPVVALKEGGRSSASGFRRFGFRNLLVVAEVALALVLLVGAGLLLKSFARLMEVDLGFRSDNLLTMQISLPSSKYGTPEQRRAFFERALEQIRTVPGVISAGAVSNLPLSGSMTGGGFTIEGRAKIPVEQGTGTDLRSTSHQYLQTMGIPLLRGRYFNDRDRDGAPAVVIIDETLARAYFRDEDPLGKRVAVEGPQWREIVGVVGRIKYEGLESDDKGQLYFPHAQDPWSGMFRMFLAVRTAAEPMNSVSAVQGAIRRLDKDLPVYRIKTMEQLVSNSVAQRRFSMFLLGLFASLALLLATVGIYGVLAHSVVERTPEIGVRMALGASKGDVLRLVIGQGMVQTLAGIGAGLIAAFGLTRLMSALLFQVKATDPLTFVLIPLLLLSMAFVACYLPARRATKIDPLVALRAE